MPNQPNDRYQQDPARIWPQALGCSERFPAQSPHRSNRSSALSWSELNSLPTDASSHRHLNPR